MWKPFFIILSLAIFAPGAMCVPAMANITTNSEREMRLERLFERLKNAPNAMAAEEVASNIKALFSENDSPTAELLLKQADQAFSSGDFMSALAILDVLTEQYPEFAEAYNRRATVLFLMGELERSANDLEQVLRIEPRHFGALGGLGLVRRAQGQLPEALSALREALAVHPFLRGAQQLVDEISQKIEHSI